MTSVATNQVAPAPAEEAAPAPSAGGGDDDKKQAAVRPPAKASGPEAEAPGAEAAPAELVLKTGKEASASALKKYAEVFRLFDKDGNGSIERDELALVLTSLGMAVSDGEIDRLMNAVDTNNDNTIDFDEFVACLTTATSSLGSKAVKFNKIVVFLLERQKAMERTSAEILASWDTLKPLAAMLEPPADDPALAQAARTALTIVYAVRFGPEGADEAAGADGRLLWMSIRPDDQGFRDFVMCVDVLAIPRANIEAAKDLLEDTTPETLGASLPVLAALYHYCNTICEYADSYHAVPVAVRAGKSKHEVRKLIRSGGNVDAEDDGAPNGGTALHEATRRGQADMVKLLLKGGANANAADRKGWTALHMAVLRVMTEEAGVLTKGIALCEILLKHGADPNLKNADRMSTPLHLAYVLKDADGRARLIKALVAHGGDETLTNCAGDTPAQCGSNATWRQDLVSSAEADAELRRQHAKMKKEKKKKKKPKFAF